jgi:hypothetical protein
MVAHKSFINISPMENNLVSDLVHKKKLGTSLRVPSMSHYCQELLGLFSNISKCRLLFFSSS